MKSMVIFGGTKEGRELAQKYVGKEVCVHICVATEYGATLLPKADNIIVHEGRMDQEEMESFLEEMDPEICVDTTHPYAVEVTKNIASACVVKKIPYLRVYRKAGTVQGRYESIVYKDTMDEVISFLDQQEGNILITTGSRDLEMYTKIRDYQTRCFARVLPTLSVMEKCKELGFEGRNLIGMQGPFTKEFNLQMLKQINAKWMVTKNSGSVGGFEEKCQAAIEAGASVVVLGRKEEPDVGTKMSLEEAIPYLDHKFDLSRKREVCLISMGPGDPQLLTQEAIRCLEESDIIIGAKRVAEVWTKLEKKTYFNSYKKEEIKAFLEEQKQYEKIAIVYSGNIGFYSGAKGMAEILQDYEVRYVTGISSTIYFLNQLGIPWEDVYMTSCHGKEQNMITMIQHHKKVCTLVGGTDFVSALSKQLLVYGMDKVKITVGERLSYSEERIISGKPIDFIDVKINALSVVFIENLEQEIETVGFGLKDSSFLRDKVPMTKEEVRAISLAKLGLKKDSIVYDVGAGSGSISMEAARLCTKGVVYAIEQKELAQQLILKNKNKFKLDNIKMIPGNAAEVIDALPAPTHVFLGGSGGTMKEIVAKIYKKSPKVRFVANAITLETLEVLQSIRETYKENISMEFVQVMVSRDKKMGNYHLMKAENPIWIVSFGGEENE